MTGTTAPHAAGGVRTAVAGVENRLARFVGVTPDDRVAVMEGMLRRSMVDTVGYWLQLILSMTIATLGLAMNSGAVVIGAMLISPLMQPLVDLGVGLATGSLLLSIRAGMRTAISVAVVILGAAGATRILPFHEITPELAARTSPTMLDLFIAVACALAAVYTTVRQGKDTISAAAGTAIGIALVPPLCTAGYGLGTYNAPMLHGALLLFTANFAAIAAVTAISVLALGFGQVEFRATEDEILEGPARRAVSHRAARLIRRTVGRRLGVLTRVLVPALLLGGILVPLRAALAEVSWQVRTRASVEKLLAEVPGAVVRQSLEVRAGTVQVRLFLVGSGVEARDVAATLRTQIVALGGRDPLVEVVAVPDTATLDALASQIRAAVLPTAPAPPLPPAPPAPGFAATFEQITRRDWPPAAGELLRARARPRSGPPVSLEIEVTYLGAPLGAAGGQVLAQRWSEELGLPVALVDRALPTAPIEAPADGGPTWVVQAAKILELTAGLEGVQLCIATPARPGARRRGPAPAPSIETVRTIVAGLSDARADVELVAGSGWGLRVGREPCQPRPEAPLGPAALPATALPPAALPPAARVPAPPPPAARPPAARVPAPLPPAAPTTPAPTTP